ncbi:MAG: T9SS type A sorting domain-containing protein [Candidatus Cloacimonetes bacterium]|nr:T9SS type A sorting domain-containing protein [Candidatus Cloacimonadota bacterium]MCK9243319.1 T9SS type A sorting domain-containing protein [Candidatus Cloacimonadota bacterium]
MKTNRNTKLSLLLAALILLTNAALTAQAAPISFEVINVESHIPDPPPSTPWMFDTDDPGFPWKDDGNPFTYSAIIDYPYHNYAYYNFYSPATPWNPAFPYSSSCTAENLDFVDGTAGFGIDFSEFELAAFQHINTVNPAAPWNTMGQAGDLRTYTNGECLVYHNNVVVMTVTDCVLRVKVHYPDVAQMHAMIGAAFWNNDVGTGQASEVTGWGTVDLLNTDPAWAAFFADPEVGNRIDFTMSSVDNIIQGRYGYYSFDLDLAAAEQAVDQIQANIPAAGLFDFPFVDVGFDFHSVNLGGPLDDLDDLLIFLIEDSPAGIFPAETRSIYPRYWQFGTTLEAFSADVTFTVDGFGDPLSWQILRRGDTEDSWQTWNDITIPAPGRIRAHNVTAFSQWAIGSTLDDTLPVVLSSFTAVSTAENVVRLSWTTESEFKLAGYRIFRGESDNLNAAMQITDLIPGTNSSTSQSYQYTDVDVFPDNLYSYWLQQSEMNGDCIFHGPLHVYVNAVSEGEQSPDLEITDAIRKIFPNPARQTTIDVSLSKEAKVTVLIYNTRGQKLRSLFSGYKSKGIHYLTWDGKDSQNTLCPSGIYLIELLVDGKTMQRSKFVLNK